MHFYAYKEALSRIFIRYFNKILKIYEFFVKYILIF